MKIKVIERMGEFRMKDKRRLAIYSLAGVYLLFLAVNMFKNRLNSTGSEYTFLIIFIIAFSVIGTGAIGYSFYAMAKQAKEIKNPPVVEKCEEEISTSTTDSNM